MPKTDIRLSSLGHKLVIMYLLNKINTFKITAVLLLCITTGKSIAQLAHNQYPCAECAVYDNNGNDLKGFIISNKNDLNTKGSKVNEYSANTWGYLQVRSALVPSVNKTGEKKGERNFGEPIMATYVLYKTKDDAQSTWWARECNSPKGPITGKKVKAEEEPLAIPDVRYETITNDLEPKNFTIVEYYNNLYNERDYDVLLKNYMLIQNGTVKDPSDYKSIIDFHNDFLKKFSYVSDPVLMKRSFITLLTGTSGAKYIGYFNVVDGKLAGKLEAIDFQYERDKDTLVKKVFTKLTGGMVYVYGDENFDLEKPIVMYARAHDIRLKRRHTNTTKKFNEDK